MLRILIANDSCSDIRPGVAAVTAGTGSELLVYLEGNLYHTSELVRWVDRVGQAASRLLSSYPTVARQVLPAGSLRDVGLYDPELGQAHLSDAQAAALVGAWCCEWVGVPHPDQLLTTATLLRQRHDAAISARHDYHTANLLRRLHGTASDSAAGVNLTRGTAVHRGVPARTGDAPSSP